MRNKIKRISKGDFDTVQPDIQFSETNIVMRIGEGELYEGSFIIQNQLDGNIRGLVYPSSYRIECKEQGFDRNPVTVHYTYDSTGMKPGDVAEGKFTVVCNGGEYDIAFTAIVEKPFVMTEYGKVQTLKDFKMLAMTDFAEAQRLFRAKRFGDLLKYEDEKVLALYSNMRKWSLDIQSLEEFLVGTKQKERICLSFADEEEILSNFMETKKEVAVIEKNTWGYLPIKIRVAGEFLKVDKTEISTEDFVGNNYYLEYIVEASKLHKGCNYGQIALETPYGEVIYPVTVQQEAPHAERHGEERLIFGCLLKCYMSFVSGRLELNAWANQSIDLVKELREIAPKNEYYELLLAHIFIRGGRTEEGKWILENYNYNRFSIGKKAEISAYYLFLTGLISKEEAHVKKIVDELNKSYAKRPQSWQILCMLLNIDPKYRNYSERVRVLQQQFMEGANQTLLYTEAYICYQEKSSLLKKLGAFELRVLGFAAKYRMITRELALYTANLATQEKVFRESLYRILVRSYQLYEEPMILTAICTLLIKGNKAGEAYFQWYQKAVDAELKIAQLYEYYMMSIKDNRMSGPLPRQICLYFAHGSTLDYKKNAYLYANILTYEDETSELFRSYQNKMEEFAWEQLQRRRINDNLRIIYKRFCNESNMNMERMKAIYDISHTYHVQTQVPHMQYVLVMEKNGTISQRVAYSEDGANVILYHKSSRIIWETDDGRHYTDSIPYDIIRLFYESQFIEMYKEKEMLLEQPVEEETVELSMETLKRCGIDYFGEEEVFRLCSKTLREEVKKANDYLLWLCFELMKKGQYDKVTLTYLANYYCGATNDMKKVWNTARAYDVKTNKLAERIISQMLFSETLFREEDIFIDYYNGGAYFGMKLGYLAYTAHEYVVRNRSLKETIVKVMINECKFGGDLPDVCKIALLKYYAEHEYPAHFEDILKAFMHELCEKQLVFPFYLEYKESWLREMLLHDKMLIEYRAGEHGKVKLTYKLDSEKGKIQTQHVEQLMPMYADIYVKQFVLYDKEQISYTFEESLDDKVICAESGKCALDREVEQVGKYGRLNAMTGMEDEALEESLQQYALEERLAEQLFEIY